MATKSNSTPGRAGSKPIEGADGSSSAELGTLLDDSFGSWIAKHLASDSLAELERKREQEREQEERRKELVKNIEELLHDVWVSREQACSTQQLNVDAMTVAFTALRFLVPTYPSRRAETILSQMSAAIQLPRRERRRLCLELVRSTGRLRAKVRLGYVAFELACLDEKFHQLDAAVLLELMKKYQRASQGRPGAMGAERIVAELVYVVNGALGFTIGDEEDRSTAVGRIRRHLQKASESARSGTEKPRTKKKTARTTKRSRNAKG